MNRRRLLTRTHRSTARGLVAAVVCAVLALATLVATTRLANAADTAYTFTEQKFDGTTFPGTDRSTTGSWTKQCTPVPPGAGCSAVATTSSTDYTQSDLTFKPNTVLPTDLQNVTLTFTEAADLDGQDDSLHVWATPPGAGSQGNDLRYLFDANDPDGDGSKLTSTPTTYSVPITGCVFIRDVTFFSDPPEPPPPGWAANIVQGSTFDMERLDLQPYFDRLMARMIEGPAAVDVTWHRDGPVYGDRRLVSQRLGQRAFQGVVLSAYSYRCAVTGDKIRPVLQAAHIRPLPPGGEHRLDNGLLLRSDVHTLFDRGYVGVDTTYHLMVSPRLRQEFGNGEEFYSRAAAKEPIAVPTKRETDRIGSSWSGIWTRCS